MGSPVVEWQNRRIVGKTTVIGAPPGPRQGPAVDIDQARHCPPEGCITYAIGNPSVWGPKASKFIDSSGATAWGIVETHLNKECLGRLETRPPSGRLVIGTPAKDLHKARHHAYTKRSNHGGAMLLPQLKVGGYAMAGSKGSDGLAPCFGIGEQWCAMESKAMPLVLWMVVYMDDTIGAIGQNIIRLMQMVAYAAARRKLVVAGGDWNMTPQQLAYTGILTEANLSIVVPSDVDATCTSGRMLDYYVVSTSLLAMIKATHTVPAPWGTHAALCLTLMTDMTAIEYPCIRRPKKFLNYFSGHVSDKVWHEASMDAHTQLGEEGVNTTPFLSDECGITDLIVNSPGAVDLTGRYARWAFAMETILIDINKVPAKLQHKYRGRGQYARIEVKGIGNSRHKSTLSAEATALEELGKVKAQVTFLCAQVRNLGTPVGDNESSPAYFLEVKAGCLDKEVLGADWVDNLESMCSNIRAHDIPQLVDMITLVRKAMSKLASQLIAEARDSFKEWLAMALLHGAKAAHKATRDVAPPPTLSYDLGQGQVAATPTEIISVKKDKFQELWTRRKGEYPLSMGQIRALIMRARKQEPLWITDDNFEGGLTKGRNGAGLGIDMVETELMKKAPTPAKKELPSILHQVQHRVVWPLQVYLNIVALLAKAAGGERAVGLMCQLYRLMGRCTMDCILDWRKERAGFWDHAVQGSSSLKAALLRVVKAEVRVARGLCTGAFFSDFQSFYDNMGLTDILDWAQEVHYPIGPLALGIQLHVAPRMIRVNGVISDPIMPANGALAGCYQATEFARLLLYGIMDKLHADFLPDQLGQIVDDVVFGATRETSKELVTTMVDMARTFVKKVNILKLPFSRGKAKLVCSKMADARAIEAALRSQGYDIFQAALKVRDVGVDFGGGRRRATAVRNIRFEKAHRRLGRTARLAKVNFKASKLAITGAMPQAFFGASAYGLPMAVLWRMRSQVARASGLGGVLLVPPPKLHSPLDPTMTPLTCISDSFLEIFTGCGGMSQDSEVTSPGTGPL